ncbi:MAG: nucleoside hydrolase [Solobacterium sp.]|nr:nucleoside hydrolase [Solobacterium sp.]
MSRHLLWIDTDTGVDDAIALLVGVQLDDVEVVGVSSVCGNVKESLTFENARNVLSLAGREDIPVYPGAEAPMCIPLETAEYVHGENGLGGASIPSSNAVRETIPAWDAIYTAAKAHPGELELVLIGPETNAALALTKYPDLKHLLKRILIMGGAIIGGNSSASAEFNIYVDPHAAEVVFRSGVPVVMCGLDVTMQAWLDEDDFRKIEQLHSPAAQLILDSTKTARELYKQRVGDYYVVHDLCPILYAVKPELFRHETAGVYVETRGSITRGHTVSDLYTDKDFEDRHVEVVLDVDRDRFVQIILEALASYEESEN